MKNINWKRKLTSRKMWAAVATFVAMMIVATGGSENTATQITGLIMAGGSMIAYIIGEGFADAAHQDDVLEDSTDSTDSEETEE
jgi:hypothetical protein|nr:MAG TPA: holin [Caudoviricetes sp.]